MKETEYKRAMVQFMQFMDWSVQEHEDKISNFIPDLSFAVAGLDGWVEVKYCNDQPKSLGHIDHWTRGQEEWLWTRGIRGGGNCFLIVGTPELHVAWVSGVLREVRGEPWDMAIRHTPYRKPTMVELIFDLNDLLVARSGR